jgi:hypothetical protein
MANKIQIYQPAYTGGYRRFNIQATNIKINSFSAIEVLAGY